MNEEGDGSKTEQATSFKLDEARRKGMVARSVELSTLGVLLAFAGYLWAFGAGMAADLQRLLAAALVQAPTLARGPLELWTWTTAVGAGAAAVVLPLLLLLAAAAALAVLLQTGFVFSVQALKPDWTRLNPANGFKRIFSLQTLFELGKTLVKLLVYPALAALVIVAAARQSMQSAGEPRALGALIGGTGLGLIFWLLAAMALFAAVDLLFVRRQFGRKMMMSRRELREELRHREGDSRIKQRRKQLARELLKRTRSLRQLRGADVLVTNPTHYAVALRYDAASMLSPALVSKGAGDFALRLKRLALVYGVPVIESKALARALYFRVPLDAQIPDAYFRETAAVYVRLRQQQDAQANPAGPVQPEAMA
jgi:flagellar biosynthesis protein FlhB